MVLTLKLKFTPKIYVFMLKTSRFFVYFKPKHMYAFVSEDWLI